VLGDAEYDFAHDGAYFARELRIAPVRDTTYNALRGGPPYPRESGRILSPIEPAEPPSPDLRARRRERRGARLVPGSP
jgi:hypothetical protein